MRTIDNTEIHNNTICVNDSILDNYFEQGLQDKLFNIVIKKEVDSLYYTWKNSLEKEEFKIIDDLEKDYKGALHKFKNRTDQSKAHFFNKKNSLK